MEWTFGQSTLEGFLQGRKQAQQSDEFRQKLMQDARNESLMNLIRQQQLQQEQVRTDAMFTDVKEGDTFNVDLGVKPGRYSNSILDNYIAIKNKPVKQQEFQISTIERNGKKVTIEHIKGQPLETGKIIGETPQWKPNEDNGISDLRKDLMNEKKQTEINKQFETVDSLVGMTQNGLVNNSGREGYNTVNKNGKGVFVDKSQWKAQAKNEVNNLADKLDMRSDVANFWIGAKKAAKTKYGVDFDSVDSSKKREFLKSIIDNSEIPEDKKRVLYNIAEIYTR
jgi:hypothetical protein